MARSRWSCSSRSGRPTTGRGCRSGRWRSGSGFTDARCARRLIGDPAAAEARSSRPAPALGAWKPIIDGWLADGSRRPEEAAPHGPAGVAAPGRRARCRGRRVDRAPLRGEAKPRRPVTLARGDRSPDHPARRRGRGRLRRRSASTCDGMLIGLDVRDAPVGVGQGFHRVYANQAQEVFIDGHVRAFEHFGGVPGRVRYDNLKPAVARVLKGRDRNETERFVALRSHYGFDILLLPPGQRGGPRKGRGRRRDRPVPPPPSGARAEGRLDGRAERAGAPRATASTTPRHIDRATDHRRRALRSRAAATCARCPPSPSRSARLLRLPGRHQVPGLRAPVLLFGPGPLCRAAHRRAPRGRDRRGARRARSVVARHAGPSARGPRSSSSTTTSRSLSDKPGALRRGHRAAPGPGLGRFSASPRTVLDAARRRLGDADGTRALIEVLLAHRDLPHDGRGRRHRTGTRRRLGRPRRGGRRGPTERPRRAGPSWPIPIGRCPASTGPLPVLARYDDLLEGSG